MWFLIGLIFSGFAVAQTPTLRSVTPTEIQAHTTAKITLVGTNFGLSARESPGSAFMCLRDSKTLMPYTYVDSTSIICTVSSNVGPGRYGVSVIRRSEAGVQSNMLFFYSSLNPQPSSSPSPGASPLPSSTAVPSASAAPSGRPFPSASLTPAPASHTPTPTPTPPPATHTPTIAPSSRPSATPAMRTSVTPSATPAGKGGGGGGGSGKLIAIAVVMLLLAGAGAAGGWWLYKRRPGMSSSSSSSSSSSASKSGSGPTAYEAAGDGAGAGADDATEMGILRVVPAAAVANSSHTQPSGSGEGLVLKKKPYVDPQTFEVSWESFTHSQVKTFVIASQDNLDGRLEAACIRTIASGVVESVRRAYFCAIDQNSGAIFLLQLTIDITTGDCNALVKSDNKEALAKFVPVLARAIDM